MKISIVIPVYNAKDTLFACLKSLNEQTVLPDEIILVDNNSTDGGLELVKQNLSGFSKLNLIIVSQVRQGPAAARNKGIQVAAGEIIAFIDSDCLADKEWVNNILSIFRDGPDLSVVGGIDGEFTGKINLVGKLLSSLWLCVPKSFDKEAITKKTDFFQDKSICTFNCAFKKNILLDLGGFNENYFPAGEDVDLWFRALEKKAKITAWNRGMVVRHPQNISVCKMCKKMFYYGYALAHLAKEHFHHKMLLHIPYFGLKEYAIGCISIFISASAVKLLILLAIIIGESFFSLALMSASLILFFIYVVLHCRRFIVGMGFKLSWIENVIVAILYLVRELAEESGRICGSVKYKLICI